MWLTGTLLPLSTMSTLWVLSGLTRTLVLLSTMSTPGSCITDYTVIRITANTGPTNPYIIVTLAPPPCYNHTRIHGTGISYYTDRCIICHAATRSTYGAQ